MHMLKRSQQKKLNPTFQGHNSSVHEEDGQKNYGNAMDACNAKLAKDEWELHSSFKATKDNMPLTWNVEQLTQHERSSKPIGIW